MMDKFQQRPIQSHQAGVFSELAIVPGQLTINDISDDIIYCIVRCIQAYDNSDIHTIQHSQISLLNLALCSKRFHQLVEPVLYETFCHSHETVKNGIVKFLTKILTRPDLSRRVKRIHTIADHPATADRGDYVFKSNFDVTCVTTEDWIRIRVKVHEASQDLAGCGEWVKEIEQGRWEAIIALMLTLVPNLEVLEFKEWSNIVMEYPIIFAYPLLWRILNRAVQLQIDRQTTNSLGLWRLKRVQQESWGPQVGINIDCLIPFLAFPSLEVLWAEMVNDEYSELVNKWPHLNLRFPNVKELSLKRANIDESSITRFLRCFPNLKRLCYRHGASMGSLVLEPPTFMDSISHLKPQLEDLTVLDDSSFKYYENQLQWYPIGSLTPFKNLRRLDINWQILTGGDLEDESIDGFPCRFDIVDAIPVSLEWLRLRDPEDIEIVPAQTLLLLEQKHRFPSLRQLDLEWERYRYHNRPWAKEPFKHLGFTKEQSLEILVKCEVVGIEMIMKAILQQPT